jgi:hypothetical protein
VTMLIAKSMITIAITRRSTYASKSLLHGRNGQVDVAAEGSVKQEALDV